MEIQLEFITPTDKIKKVLRKSGFTVGRGSAADLIFTNQELSRVHFKIDVEGSEVYITDLGSSNGTYLNLNKIQASTKILLQSNDKISFGNHKSYYFKIKLLQADELVQPANIQSTDYPVDVPKAPVEIELEQDSPIVETSFSEVSEVSEVKSKVFDISSEKMPVSSNTKFDISAANPAKEAYEREKRLQKQKATALKLVVEQLQEHADQAKLELDMLSSKKIKFIAEIEEYKEKQESIKELVLKLEQKKETLLSENSELENKINKNNIEIQKNLHEQKSQFEEAMRDEHVLLQGKIQTLKTELEQLTAEISLLKSEKQRLNAELLSLKNQIVELKKEKELLLAENNKMTVVTNNSSFETVVVGDKTVTEFGTQVSDNSDAPSKLPTDDKTPAIPLTMARAADVETDFDFVQMRYYKTLSDLAIIEESIDQKLMLLELLEGELGIPEKNRKVS